MLIQFAYQGVQVNRQGKDENLNQGGIDSFGHEWAAFDYTEAETAQALNARPLAYCATYQFRSA